MAKKSKKKGFGTLLVLILILGGLVWYYWPPKKAENLKLSSGINIKFHTSAEKLQVYKDGKWQDFFVKGVNLGAAIPGHDPGELAIPKSDYLRWFSLIGEMGANTIRIYTIQKPAFYAAIVEYNEKHPNLPLYYIQGIWSPEEAFTKTKDARSPEAMKAFKAEIADAVSAVYGTKTLVKQLGKASGSYEVNAGAYLLGWSMGTEWDPQLVKNTNKLHPNQPLFKGEFFQAKAGASPFESLLAEMINTIAALENKEGWQHPQTFTNWVTTDPLTHPGEVLYEEDLVSVDPMHIEPVKWDAGYFASYHVYPYYPDFFLLDKSLQTVRNDKGQIDTYKAYLQQLKAHHLGIPLMITEFGVPSSIGIAHIGNLGRNQGGHNEQEQGAIDADLYHLIVQEHMAGGILFTWQDEWFKKTWNTMHFEIPEDRRKLWLNVLTNEEMFGVLAMDPSKSDKLYLDGDLNDWDKLNKNDVQKVDVNVPGMKGIRITHDEAYVYIAVELTADFKPEQQTIYLGVDTTKGGNRHAPQLGTHKLDEGLESLITLGTDKESQVSIASNYNFHTRLYGARYGMFPLKAQAMKDDSGLFDPWMLATGLKLDPPDGKTARPFEEVKVGQLIRGTNNPTDPQFNSTALWQFKGNVVEIRIPWMLLGFTDPSSLSVMGYPDAKDSLNSIQTKGIHLVPWIVNRVDNKVIGLGEEGSVYPVSKLPLYTWKGWEEVTYIEREKASYASMKQAYTEK
ncbi:MAG: hypothetical protein JWM44_763 [Bacilli bacterium]|nr:hypothetical protein [Bacilli bacterium]